MSNLEPNYGRRMTNAEAVLLCRYAKAACPQQAFDQYTPDAWSDLLGDLRFEDCKEALRNIVQRQPFVAPAEIRDEVKRVRTKRIVDFGPLPDPPMDSDYDEAEYRQYIRETLRKIGDGEIVKRGDEEPFAVTGRDVIKELGHVGQSIDSTEATRPLREAHAEAKRDLQAADAERKERQRERQAELERMRAADRAARANPDRMAPTEEDQ